MTRKWTTWVNAAAFTAIMICASGLAAVQSARAGQYGGQQPAQQPKQQPPAQTEKDKQPAPLTLDASQPPVSAEEEAAMKAIQDTPPSDSTKKAQLSEDFLQKYPNSRYRPIVYQALVSVYFSTNQSQKLIDVGQKEIELTPNDTPVLAIVAQTIARTFNPSAPDAMKKLDAAEQYSKRAIEVTPTLPKPPNLTDDAFTSAKNDTLSMAHSGLGLVYIRKGKFSESIPELEQAVKTDTHPEPDPVNYYLLGLANQKTSHYDSAAAAFNKCAAMQSSLQPTCKSGAEQAKKQGSSELSAPN
jgi:tetratricopeptide (TPR) repeat protein